MTALRIPLLSLLLGLSVLLPIAGDPIVATGIWLLCLVILARSHPNGLLSFAALYLLLLGVFHLGLVAPIAVGLTAGKPPEWMASPYLPSAIGLVSTATAAFTLGARLAPIPREQGETAPQRWLVLAGGTVAVLGAVLLWIGALQLGILSAGYGEYFDRSANADVRLFGFGMMVFPIGVVIAAVGATRRQLWALGALVPAVLGPFFLAGFRGPTIVQVATLLAVWARKDARLAHRLAIVAVALAIVLVPAIRATRDGAGDVAKGLGPVDPLAVLLEAGGSLQPLVVTAERIGSRAEPLWLGRSYLLALERVVPNVGRRAAQQADEGPSAWATKHANRWLWEHGGGIGFSGIAEPYLNFGTAGVVVLFLLLGIVIQRWERWLAREPFRAAIGAATFSFVLWTVRNESLELFRSMAIAGAVVGAARIAQWTLSRPQLRRPASTSTSTTTV